MKRKKTKVIFNYNVPRNVTTEHQIRRIQADEDVEEVRDVHIYLVY